MKLGLKAKTYSLWFVSSAVQSKQNQHRPAWADWVLWAFWGTRWVVRVTPKSRTPNRKGAVGNVRNRDKTTTLPAPECPRSGWLGSANSPRTCLRGSVRFPSRTYSIFCKRKHVTYTHTQRKPTSKLTLFWLNPDFLGLGPPSLTLKTQQDPFWRMTVWGYVLKSLLTYHHIHTQTALPKCDGPCNVAKSLLGLFLKKKNH